MNKRTNRKIRIKRRGVAVIAGAVYGHKEYPFPPYIQVNTTLLLKDGDHMEIQTVLNLEQDPYGDYIVRYLAERVENDGAVYHDGDILEIQRFGQKYCTVEMVQMADGNGVPYLRAVILGKGMEEFQRLSLQEIRERIDEDYEVIYQ